MTRIHQAPADDAPRAPGRAGGHEPDRATPVQVHAVNNQFWYLGYRRSDRPERLAACAALLGLDALASTRELTGGQAGQLVRRLSEFRTGAQLEAALAACAGPAVRQQATSRSRGKVPAVAGAPEPPAAGRMSEAELNREIRRLCDQFGLYAMSMTTYRIPGASKRPGSSKGYPDWTIVGAGGVLFREAKSEDGRRSMAQIQWAKAITAAGGDYGLWRPSDLAARRIERELRAVAQLAAV